MTLPAHPLSFTGTDELRASRRFRIELPVMVATMISDQKGWIVDVSRQGLKVRGIKAQPRMRVCVHYKGYSAEGRVRWSKPRDGIGIVLDVPLRTGPLAAVWRRFHENVEAFGKHERPARPVFGRRSVP